MKVTKKEILSSINQLQGIVKDKEYYKEQLNSNELSDLEKDLIENDKLPTIYANESHLNGLISYMLKNYLLQKGKGLVVDFHTYNFLFHQGIS